MSRRVWIVIVAIAGTVPWVATRAWGCDVPVFRYALERWEATPYELLVFQRGDLSKEQSALLDAVRKPIGARDGPNLNITVVDLTKAMDGSIEKVWSSQGDVALPRAVLCYPRSEPDYNVAWTGDLSAANLKALIDSPVRQQIARHIRAGDSAVWVLLESGDKVADDGVAKRLEAGSKALVAELMPPPTPGVDRAPGLDPGVGPAPDEPMFLPTPGLDPDGFDGDAPPPPPHVAFSVVRLSRHDPAELILVDTLLHSQVGLGAAKGPVVFPIFGRGRALCVLRGEDLAPAAMRQVGEFVCGDCSCEVKDQNPGFDLLITTDWTALGNPVVVGAPPGAGSLVGLGSLAAAATQPLPIADGGMAGKGTEAPANWRDPVAEFSPLGSPLVATLALTAMLAALGAVATVFFVTVRARRTLN